MRKHTIRQLGAALLSGAMLLTAVPAAPSMTASAAGNCSIDTGTTYQIIRGFGGMNHPEWQSVNTQYGAGGDMTAEQVQTAFGNGENELGLTILRIFVSDDSNAWKNAVPTAKRAQALGATVFATPWNPPASMRHSGGGTDQTGLYVLNDGAEGAYAQHLNNYVKYMEGQGINLYSISVQNEPDYSREWTFWSPQRAAEFIANYGQAVKDGTNAKLMSPESFQYGPESWGYGKNYYKQIINNQQAFANCDLFGTHFYGTSRDSMNYPTVEECGKEIWMTEVYVPNSDANSADNWDQALQAAENIHNGLVVGNMSAYVWWYIRRQYSLMWDDGRVSKRGACMAQYSKWVRPGDYRIACTESPESNILVSAYKNADGQVKVVAINKGDSVATENFNLTSGEKISNVSAWHSTSTENFRACNVASVGENGFTAQLPAASVTTFVVDTGDAEPDPDGYFFHDRFEGSVGSWTGRGAASVMTSGRTAYDGSEALLVQERTAAWNGATRPLSASVFKAGTAYSFSVDAMYFDGDPTQTFHLTLEYTGSDGEAHYDKIATASAVKGEWVQLANQSYTIPSDATNMKFYVETAESADGTYNNFYIDEAIGAPEGTVIDGPKAVTFTLGDLNDDGRINAVDLTLAKRGLMKGFASKAQELACDVTKDGSANIADVVWYVQYLTGQISDFGKTASAGESGDTPETAEHRPLSVYAPIVQQQIEEYEDDNSKKELSGVSYGTIEKKEYYSNFCKRTKPYIVLKPANYDPNKKYPVLYVMHGYYENQERMIIVGNDTVNGMPTRQIIGNAIASGDAEDMLVVFPYIYSSQTQNDCTGMNDENNQAYDNFETVLINELMPEIAKNYSVKTGKENTAITGFSMGGRESLNIGLKHPDLFGYVGSICAAPGVPTIKWSGDDSAPYLLMMTAGSNDQTVWNGPVEYHNNAESAGTPHVWHYVNGGYHGDNCIRAHLYNFVRAIFKA